MVWSSRDAATSTSPWSAALGEPEIYSVANLTIDPTRERDLFATLKRTPAAVAVDFRKGALASFRQMSDAVAVFIRKVEVMFAIIIAFGVVYNTAKIALAERSRELATLRILGFTRSEVSAILLGELGALAAPAIPLGLLIGHWLSGVVIGAWAGERMHPPVIVAASTYGLALLVFVFGVAASALLVRRNLDRLDLVGVLKARE